MIFLKNIVQLKEKLHTLVIAALDNSGVIIITKDKCNNQNKLALSRKLRYVHMIDC